MSTTTSNFPRAHAATALKYAGISFIAGAVNHGFFSEYRSLVTAAIGMVAFVLGTWLDHEHGKENAQTLLRQILIGALFSIGLGFFTGGLQHFPDSPARSLWVVPLGFSISIFAFGKIQEIPWQRPAWLYAILSSALILGAAYLAYRVYQVQPLAQHTSAIGQVGQAHAITRTIEIVMDDNMRFDHDDLEVEQGETIRFVIKNKGKLPHEFVLGTREDLIAHATVMAEHAQSGQVMPHDEPNQVSVAPDQSTEVIWQFTQAGVVDFACLVPGHFEAGMRGRIVVRGKATQNDGHAHSH